MAQEVLPTSTVPSESMSTIASLAELEAIYGLPAQSATVKEVARMTPEYCALIAASPFAVMATSGPKVLDCSPRGDLPGFVRCTTSAG